MKLLAAILTALILATAAVAQTPSDTETQTAIRRALEELQQRRLEVDALKVAGKAKDDHIQSLEAIIERQAQLISLWKTAAEERHNANDSDARIEASYKESVSRYAVELANVRIDRDRANATKKWWFAAGIVIGVVAGVFAAKD